MKLYINPNINPYFNLAAEEYLLTHADDDIIMLWRNEPAVIIGKNQNAFAEINFDFVREHGVKVVRRLTGGGAVFHDLGNVNFTFVSPPDGLLARGIRDGGLDFAHFTRPVVNALGTLGLKAELSGRNDIIVHTDDGERKVSGNAQCVVDGVTLHHGTLLFSAALDRLQGALNVDPAKLKSKGIASVRSRVANIYDLLAGVSCKAVPDVMAFINFLAEYLTGEFGTAVQSFTAEAKQGIEALAKSKYACDEWNLQRFGSFGKKCSKRFLFGTLEAELDVENGFVSNVRFSGDFFGIRDISELCCLLKGVEFSRDSISRALADVDIGAFVHGADAKSVVSLICDVDTVS